MKDKIMNNKTKKILKYFIVNTINFTIEISAFTFLYKTFNLNYNICFIISFSIIVITSYFLNKNWVFKYNSKKNFLSYSFTYLINFNFKLFFINFLIKIIKISPFYSTIFSSMFSTIFAYILLNIIIFR
ncbi:MAG: GtrA-like protein [Fusobacteriaceae bacterium]|jgi:putative flippase GtrA|nr:GtrA-like protein [Fusobacteriaceae bacterium]